MPGVERFGVPAGSIRHYSIEDQNIPRSKLKFF